MCVLILNLYTRTHTHNCQIFRPVDILDVSKDFNPVLTTLLFLHNIASGELTIIIQLMCSLVSE